MLVNAIKGKPPGPDGAQGQADDTCPYQGLEVFDEEHAEFFFGRERDVQRLVGKAESHSLSRRVWRIRQRKVIAGARRIDSRT